MCARGGVVSDTGAARLTDVARAAGVSIATASRVLNGSNRVVGAELVQRVMDAAERLGYAANAQAQAVSRGTTNIVGLLVTDISDPYFSAIAAGVSAGADEHGLLVMLCTADSPERELALLRSLRGQRSRAIILAGSRSTGRTHLAAVTAELEAFAANGGRAAAISEPKLPIDTVVVDNRGGAKELAQTLAARGYRRPAMLTGPQELLVSLNRSRGFAAACVDAGIGKPVQIAEAFSWEGGWRAMQRLLREHPNTDLVFAANDLMALGAMAACREQGVQVGSDLGIAGFDDLTNLRDISPSLTTVALPLHDLGRAAVEMITRAPVAPGASPRRHRVTGTVVLRDSTPSR